MKCVILFASNIEWFYVLAQVNNVFIVAGESSFWLLSALTKSFCTEFSYSRAVEYLRKGRLQQIPAGNISFVILRPETSDAGQVNTYIGRLSLIILLVCCSHLVVNSELLLNVLAVSAVEGRWVMQWPYAGT